LLGAVVMYLLSKTRNPTTFSVGSLVLTETPARSVDVANIAPMAIRIDTFVMFIPPNFPFSDATSLRLV
jgi:hypothetical protein